jgi:hypothetical protein
VSEWVGALYIRQRVQPAYRIEHHMVGWGRGGGSSGNLQKQRGIAEGDTLRDRYSTGYGGQDPTHAHAMCQQVCLHPQYPAAFYAALSPHSLHSLVCEPPMFSCVHETQLVSQSSPPPCSLPILFIHPLAGK